MLDVSLERPRIKASDLHLWADYIELHCLASADREAGAESLLREHWDSRSGLASIGSGDTVEDVPGAPDSPLDSAEISDRFRLRLHDLFAYFETRSALFGEAYPFQVLSDDNTLVLKPSLDHSHELYAFFLLAGNLRFFGSAQKELLTKDFETVCADRLKALFPGWFEFRIFGTSSHPEIAGYSGNKYSKLSQLAENVNARLIAEETEYDPRDRGDCGVDVVAWMPFDSAPNAPVFFIQCGCTADAEEMIQKQVSVSRDRWNGILANCFHYSFMVTPVCYRDANGSWPRPSEIRSAFIDRPRMMRICSISAGIPMSPLGSLGLARQALRGPS